MNMYLAQMTEGQSEGVIVILALLVVLAVIGLIWEKIKRNSLHPFLAGFIRKVSWAYLIILGIGVANLDTNAIQRADQLRQQNAQKQKEQEIIQSIFGNLGEAVRAEEAMRPPRHIMEQREYLMSRLREAQTRSLMHPGPDAQREVNDLAREIREIDRQYPPGFRR